MSQPLPELEISGGAGSVYAVYEDIATLAGHSAQLGVDLGAIALRCHRYLGDLNVLASAPLNPDGVARFELALLRALDGPRGLSLLAADLGTDAVALAAAAAAYVAADWANAALIDSARWAAGFAFGLALPFLIVPGMLAGGLGAAALFSTPQGALTGAALWSYLEENWEVLLSDHPGVIDLLIGTAPGLIGGLQFHLTGPWLPPITPDVPASARLLAMLYPDGSPEVTGQPVPTVGPNGRRPTAADVAAMNAAPEDLHDLLSALEVRAYDALWRTPGVIDIRIVTDANGNESWIVDIPGTREFQPIPGQHQQINDLGTNLHAMAGAETSYQQGIVEALQRAGYSGEPIMLVGHSQGGIVAANMVNDLAHGGVHTSSGTAVDLNVTHVVTVGSPIARIDIPDDVQLLALESNNDIVPHLDAADNPQRSNVVTVSFDAQHGNLVDNHLVDAYLPAAQALDQSNDPSVRAWMDRAGGFFTAPGTTASTEVHLYTVSRTF